MFQYIVLDLRVGCPILKFGHIHIFQRELNPNLFRVDLALGKQDNRLKDISERTDIYSLGAVFFWLLAGRKPVGDTNTDESTVNDIKQIKEQTFDWRKLPLCTDASDGVIKLLQRIFEKTLSTTVSARYDDTEMRFILGLHL